MNDIYALSSKDSIMCVVVVDAIMRMTMLMVMISMTRGEGVEDLSKSKSRAWRGRSIIVTMLQQSTVVTK